MADSKKKEKKEKEEKKEKKDKAEKKEKKEKEEKKDKKEKEEKKDKKDKEEKKEKKAKEEKKDKKEKEEKKDKKEKKEKAESKKVDKKEKKDEKEKKEKQGKDDKKKASLVEEAVKTGAWAEVRDPKTDKVTSYDNKRDKRCKESRLTKAELEKFLQEKGIPADDEAGDDDQVEEEEEEEEAPDIEGEFPASYAVEGVEGLTEEEKTLRLRLQAAYAKGWSSGKTHALVKPKVDPASRPQPRPTVSAPVTAREDWAPVEWPKWQSLLMEPHVEAGRPAEQLHPPPQVELRGLGLTPEQRAQALWASPLAPYHDNDILQVVPPSLSTPPAPFGRLRDPALFTDAPLHQVPRTVSPPRQNPPGWLPTAAHHPQQRQHDVFSGDVWRGAPGWLA